MKEKTISIVVPVYKVEKYLRRSVESVLFQTWRDWEMILVDDGSPDRCGAICDEYAGKDGRIRVIHQKNRGVSAARNAGLDAAEGAYIYCLDPDDYLPGEALETLYRRMEETGADIVVAGHSRVEADGRIHCDSDGWPELTETKDIQRAILRNDLPNFVWGRLYRRAVWEGIRMPEGQVMEDLFVCPSLYMKAKKIVVDKEPLYFYSHENAASIMAISGARYARLRYGKFLAWREHERIAEAHFPEDAPVCAREALYAAVRAQCLAAGIDILTAGERAVIDGYVRSHEKTAAPWGIRWMRWLILHQQEGLLALAGRLQRRLVDHQQERRQRKMQRKQRQKRQ